MPPLLPFPLTDSPAPPVPPFFPPPHTQEAEQEAGRRAQETLEIITEISQLLNTGLDRESVSILTSLCEMGVNPEALAAVVKELRRESEAIKVGETPMRVRARGGRSTASVLVF